jgi:hypothetical protein
VFNPGFVGVGGLALLLAVGSLQAAAVDPTRPASIRGVATVGAKAKPRPLVLQSIRISAQQRRAVISGVKVEEGSRIRGAKVIRIAPGEVLLQQGSKQTRLGLAANKIKRYEQEQN